MKKNEFYLSSWIVVIVLLISIVTCEPAKAQSLQYFGYEFSEVYNERDPYLPEFDLRREQAQPDQGEYWDTRSAILFNLNLIEFTPSYRMYWDNEIYGFTTTQQYRTAGWEWEAGFQLDRVDLFWHHHSRHVLEQERDLSYPLHDRYGLRITFYGDK